MSYCYADREPFSSKIPSSMLTETLATTPPVPEMVDVDQVIDDMKLLQKDIDAPGGPLTCGGIDRISELPDEIIVHILSFLPLEDAVPTSILSPRWLNLWKYIPNLIFVNESHSNEPMINIPSIAIPIEEPINWRLVHSFKNVEWVNSVLNSYKALSIKQFAFSLYIHQNDYHHVSKWLQFAFSRQVESLKLGLGSMISTLFVLDTNTLSGIQICDYKFLRELTLESIIVSGEAIEFLLHNCSLLERLIMQGVLKSDLVIRGPLLKYLEMIFPQKARGKFIKVVFAPNLTRLRCDYDTELLSLGHVPNLVEASFNLVGPKDTRFRFPNEAANLEILSITLYRPTAFSVPQMPKLKKLALHEKVVSMERYLLPVTCLLQASPNLEEFKFKQTYVVEFYRTILEVPKNVRFRYTHYALKVFEFAGFRNRARDHFELVMYIVNNCVALEEIIITPVFRPTPSEFYRRTSESWRSLGVVDAVTQELRSLGVQKCTEQLFAGKIPHHVKLIVHLGTSGSRIY